MKKTALLILGIVTLCIATSPLRASDRKENKRVEQGRSSPEPSCHSCGLWRVCFSCCCKPKTVDKALVILDVIHAAIEVVLLGTPGAIREIYLLCQNAGYALSKIAIHALRENGFLDERSNLKDGWRDHILQLLAHDGKAAGPQEFYFEQSIEDLTTRYSEVVYQLGIAAKARNVYIPAMITTLLHGQYQLIALPTKITLEELAAIAAACDKSPTKNEISRSTASSAPQSRFRLRSTAEARSRRSLENSVIIN